ncbi:histidine kinase [Taibaiella koreensis]|uniref:histidine kinase n=1 Tax=Taibaiella koreensis TaxID=1268548 RepID=UPI000E59C549|nr:histidine kinase [Taibaiella koreensis]
MKKKPFPSYCASGILLLFSLFLLPACTGEKDDTHKLPDLSVSEEEQLYRAYVDSALSHNSAAFLDRLDSTMPARFRDDYRIIGYRQFLQGYKAYKKGKKAAAAQLFNRMLHYARVDTARDYDLITLKQSALVRLQMDSSVGAGTFALLVPIMQLNERPGYQSRYRWWTYNLAAEVSFRADDPNRAEQFLEISQQTFADTGDYSVRGQFMSQQSRIAGAQKDFRKALLYEDSAYALAKKAGDQQMMAISIAAQGVLYIRMGNREKGYALQNQAFELKKKLQTADLPQEYLNMSYSRFDERDYAGALKYAREAQAIAEQKNDEEAKFRTYEELAKIHRALQDYDSAFTYLIMTFNSSEQLSAMQKREELAALDLNYSLKQQQHRAQELTLKNESQATILKQQRILIFAFGFSLIVSVLLAYAFIRQRKLQAANESMELEQRLLRSQMDPHFIFNTLSSLQGFIRNDEKDKSIRYLNQFARLLRVSLENSRESFVSLQKEVDGLKNYLSLQYMRFENLFDYHIGLYEGYDEDDILIPPMLIQPFVENAIQHGIQNLSDKGHIDVTIDRIDGTLRCTIEDNGNGMQPKTASSGKQSLSTYITRERLELLSKNTGKKADLRIIDKTTEGKGKGILVIMDIPYLPSGKV